MTEPHAARKLSLPLPEVFGLGVMTSTSGLDQVGPVLDPLRVALADDEDDGREVGQRAGWAGAPPSPSSIRPFLRMASVSDHRASVTTSASSPSMTARAWLPEPPCDCLIVSSTARLLLVLRDERLVQVAPQLARRVVRDVQQLRGGTRAPATAHKSKYRHDHQEDGRIRFHRFFSRGPQFVSPAVSPSCEMKRIAVLPDVLFN